MRIGLVGNSHTAALLRSTRLTGFPGHTFEFLLVAGGMGPRLRIEEGRLFNTSPVGEMRSSQAAVDVRGFDLSGCDAVICIGVGLRAHRDSDPNHPFGSVILGALAPLGFQDRQVVSEAVMSLCIAGKIANSANARNLSLVRSIFAGPVLAVASPPPSRMLETALDSDLPRQYGDQLPRFLTWYYREQLSAVATAAQAADALLVTPPDEVFSAGFIPDAYKHKTTWHANPAYGGMMMRRAIAMLGGAAPA